MFISDYSLKYPRNELGLDFSLLPAGTHFLIFSLNVSMAVLIILVWFQCFPVEVYIFFHLVLNSLVRQESLLICRGPLGNLSNLVAFLYTCVYLISFLPLLCAIWFWRETNSWCNKGFILLGFMVTLPYHADSVQWKCGFISPFPFTLHVTLQLLNIRSMSVSNFTSFFLVIKLFLYDNPLPVTVMMPPSNFIRCNQQAHTFMTK